MHIRNLISAFSLAVLALPAPAQTQQEMDAVAKMTHAPQTKTSTLSFLAGAASAYGTYAKAAAYYEQMLKLYEADNLPERALWAKSKIAMMHYMSGDKSGAKKEAASCSAEIDAKKSVNEREKIYIEQATEICGSIQADKVQIQTKLDTQGEEAKAKAAVAEAEKAGAYSQKYALALLDLARAYRYSEKYSESAEAYSKCIYIIDNMAGPLNPATRPLLEEYAMVLDAAGNKTESAKIRVRIKSDDEHRAAAKSGPGTWATHFQAGAAAMQNRDLATAKKEVSEALKLAKGPKELLLSHAVYGQTLEALSEFDEAEKTLKDGLAIAEKNNMTGSIDYASMLRTLGDILRGKKQYEAAEKQYNLSLDYLSKVQPEDESQRATKLLMVALTRMGMSKSAAARGDMVTAKQQQDLAVQAIKEHEAVKH